MSGATTLSLTRKPGGLYQSNPATREAPWVRYTLLTLGLGFFLLFLVLPLLGAATIGALWINLEQSSLELGLIWAGIGVTYLFLRLAVFRIPFRQYEEAADGQ